MTAGDGQVADEEEGEGGGGPSPAARSKAGAAALESYSGVDEDRLTCEAAITVPLNCPKLLMREIVEKVAAETIMRGIPGGHWRCCCTAFVPSPASCS